MTVARWNLRSKESRSNGLCPGRCCGFTLPLAIVILAVMGNIALVIFTMVKAERVESFRRYTKCQAELNIESGLDFAFARIQSASQPWRTEGLQYNSPDSSVSFSLSHVQNGVYSRLQVFSNDSAVSTVARPGFRQPALPALTFISSKATLAISRDASVKGGISIAEGNVNYSTHYRMMANKNSYYDTAYTDIKPAISDSLKFFPELSRNQFDSLYKKDLCEFDAKDVLPQELSCRNVIVQGDALCDKCSIRANKVRIRGNAIFKGADIRAISISATGNADVSGVLFARDSIFVDLDRTQEHPLRIALQGRKSGPAEYTGRMDIERISAKNILLLFIGDNWEETLHGIPIRISEKCDLTGLVVSIGSLDLRGHIRGSVITRNLVFEEDGTLWRNFLRETNIERDSTIDILLPDILHLGGTATYEKM